MAENYIRPEDVSPQDAKKVLYFLNAAQTAEEIAETIEIPGERDVGIRVAQNILDRRQELGGFKNLAEVADVPHVGPERFTEIITILASARQSRRSLVQQLSTCQANLSISLNDYIKKLEEAVSNTGDDAQFANIDLQNMLQHQQQVLQMMSNILKMIHDTARAIIRNLK